MPNTSASVRETGRRTTIANAILSRYQQHSQVYVNHGSAYSAVGRPDLDGCVYGQHFGFEVKNDQGKLTKIQIYRLKQLKTAGAIVGGVRTPNEALRLLDRGLAHLERPDTRLP
jgi:hypothetical protein